MLKDKPELLIPARDLEVLKVAYNYGADACYIGGEEFSLRAMANNFSDEDLKLAVDYAHQLGKKIYVTANIYARNNHIEEAKKYFEYLNTIKPDAVLISDLGLFKIAKDIFTNVDIHISTQANTTNYESVLFYKELGATRVVLARELSLNEIKVIREKCQDVELEAFVHGALCVSYSGQCYLSQFIGGRSANRGECAQPCRKKYRVFDSDGKEYIYPYPLCLKDFNASKYLKEMIDSGVYSFKIEGRLKDIGYVKNVVSYYRQLLDKYSDKSSSGRCIYPFTPDVERSFNRGFTDYFLNGRGNCYNPISPKSRGKYIGRVKSNSKCSGKLTNSICVITDVELHNGDGICCEIEGKLEGFLVNKVEKI